MDLAPPCRFHASQVIIKIITVACANSVQVLRHNTRWDRAPYASSQGPGSSRLPWEPSAPSFLSLLLCTLPLFNLRHAFSDNPHPPWYIHTIHACTHIKKLWHTSRQAEILIHTQKHVHTHIHTWTSGLCYYIHHWASKSSTNLSTPTAVFGFLAGIQIQPLLKSIHLTCFINHTII